MYIKIFKCWKQPNFKKFWIVQMLVYLQSMVLEECLITHFKSVRVCVYQINMNLINILQNNKFKKN